MKTKPTLKALAIAAVLLALAAGCTKPADNNNNNNPVTGTVTDTDGNVYQTVKIGTQTWMAANLTVTRYRDGSPIASISDGWDWWHTGAGAYCTYDNSTANGAVYGKLYNWYAVNTGKLAPTGWHVPTDADWQTLENFIGNTQGTEGGKLKERDTLHWLSPNAYATNQTGFTALPGGSRGSTGGFGGIQTMGVWWSATQGTTDTGYGRYRFLDFSLGDVFNNEDYKVDGNSVRCVKD